MSVPLPDNRAIPLATLQRYNILDVSPEPIVTYDSTGNVIYVNPAFEALFGWTQEELSGRPIDFVPEESQAETELALERLFSTGQLLHFETKRLTKRGDIVEVEQSGSLFKNEANDVAGSLMFIRDITQRKQTEIDQTKLLADTAEQTRRLTLLNEMSRALNQTTSEAEVQAVVAKNIAKIIETQRVSLAMITSEGDQVEILALDGEKGVIPTGTKLPLRGTSVGQTIQEQRIIITADTRESSYLDTLKLSQQGLLSTISTPLVIGDHVLGSLNIANLRVGAYDEQDERLLQQLATLVASMLENRRLFAQTQAALAEAEIQAQRLELLYQMGQDLHGARSEAEMFNIAAGVVTQIFSGSRGSLALLDKTSTYFEVLSLEGDEAIPLGVKLPVANTILGEVVRQNCILMVQDFEAEAWRDYLDIQNLMNQGLRACIDAPLRVGDQVIGTLNVAIEQANAYPPHYESLIGQTAAMLSSALENLRYLQATQARVRREKLLREVTEKVRSSVDVDTVMRTAATEVGKVLGRSAFVIMEPDEQEPTPAMVLPDK